jgi:hypothetical protein
LFHGKINIRLFFLLSLGFILFTVIGTLSHEAGHYFVAKMKGYHAEINYGYTYWSDRDVNELLKEYKENISDPLVKKKYDALVESSRKDSFQIILGGPIQTVLTGTMGLALILWRRKKFYQLQELVFSQWLLVFTSLFWLRQLFNFANEALIYFLHGYISSHGDEVKIASWLGWNKLSVLTVTGTIAAGILYFVIFKIIPAPQRISFMAAGLAGGMLGFYLWLHLVGPMIMP